MAVSVKLGLKQSQKLVMTQSLRQSIEMLQLSTIELSELISAEMLDNPILEEEKTQAEPSLDIEDLKLVSQINLRLSGDDSIYSRNENVNLSYEDLSDRGYSSAYDDDDRKRTFIENSVLQKETLKEHLLWQARLLAQNKKQLNIFERIITSIDEKGFLKIPLDKFADENKLSLSDARKAVDIIKFLDPVGCAVPGVQESLIVQAESFYKDDLILRQILSNYFKDLESLDYKKISRELNLPVPDIIEKSKLIQNLVPFPGGQYSTKDIRYIIPDVDVKYIDEEIIVSLNDDWLPCLKINTRYVNLLKNKSTKKEIKGYIQDKMKSARYLLKNIGNRRDTIIKTVRAMMEYQIDFLKNGPGHLKPLTHIDIAKEIGMHESTVSRVTSNKFVQTSWGVFELKYFFVSKLKTKNAGDHSSDIVMNQIKEIISREDPASPLSDDDILNELRKEGIDLARRTIAKYRGIMNIPSSHKRKKINMFNRRD